MKITVHKKCQSHPAPNELALDTVPLFKNVAPEFLDQLKSASSTHDYAKGHVVFMQDDVAEWFYVVNSGWIKLFRQTLDGDEVIIDILPAGTLFGETELFSNHSFANSAEVVQDAKITAYPMSLLRNQISSDPSFAVQMLEHILHGQREQTKEIEHRTIMNASQRLGCFLLRLINVKKHGPVVLHLPYDKTLIASRLGMQSETFSRALARLKADLGVRVKGATIEIDSMDALISYTCSACSNAFPCAEE